MGGVEGAAARRRLGRPRCPRRSQAIGAASVEPGAYDGRNLHFGIREHAMGATVNGLVLSGFRAFGSGFLIFSDYMKGVDPPRRRSCGSRRSSSSPTTRSASARTARPTSRSSSSRMLRAQPNIDVVRPAGANETALAYRFALTPDRDARP